MFLSIEGMEGSGKSTLAGLLCAGIEGKGMPVVSTREPGGCLLGKELRRILLNRASVLEDDAELFLFLAWQKANGSFATVIPIRPSPTRAMAGEKTAPCSVRFAMPLPADYGLTRPCFWIFRKRKAWRAPGRGTA